MVEIEAAETKITLTVDLNLNQTQDHVIHNFFQTLKTPFRTTKIHFPAAHCEPSAFRKKSIFP